MLETLEPEERPRHFLSALAAESRKQACTAPDPSLSYVACTTMCATGLEMLDVVEASAGRSNVKCAAVNRMSQGLAVHSHTSSCVIASAVRPFQLIDGLEIILSSVRGPMYTCVLLFQSISAKSDLTVFWESMHQPDQA